MGVPSVGAAGRVRIALFSVGVVGCFCLMGCGDDDDGTKPPGDDEDVAPVIDSLTVSPLVVAPGDTAQIVCFARDADGDSLIYSWQPMDGTIVGSGAAVRWVSTLMDGPHEIVVDVTDGKGGVARDTASSDVFGGTMLVQSRDGMTAVNAYGESFLLSTITSSIEVLGTQIFVKGSRSITEIDHSGGTVQTIEISDPSARGYEFAMLPDGGFAFLSNEADSVHFMGPDGTYLVSVGMPNPASDLQNLDGIVVGNRLIVSENGNNELVAFDLGSHAGSVFRSFPEWGGWLGAIDYSGARFYLCGYNRIRSFMDDGPAQDICELPESNITGIAVVGSYAYVVVNFGGALYRVDTRTGAYEVFVDGLDYPQDIEYLPIALVPPPKKR